MSLHRLTIETELGAVYEFPDVDDATVAQAIELLPRRGMTLTLVNVSGAYLAMPCRIIRRVSVDGVERWNFPV